MGWALAGLLVALASVVAVPGFGGVATKTKRVSVSSTGAQADGGSGGASISANGRFVAFASGATNLAGGDTNGPGVLASNNPNDRVLANGTGIDHFDDTVLPVILAAAPGCLA